MYWLNVAMKLLQCITDRKKNTKIGLIELSFNIPCHVFFFYLFSSVTLLISAARRQIFNWEKWHDVDVNTLIGWYQCWCPSVTVRWHHTLPGYYGNSFSSYTWCLKMAHSSHRPDAIIIEFSDQVFENYLKMESHSNYVPKKMSNPLLFRVWSKSWGVILLY